MELVAEADFHWHVGSRTIECADRTQVMGILNVTPDSFSDGGRNFDPEVAVEAGLRMAAEGGDLLDVGGESTRPAADPVSADEEVDRVVPVIEQLAAEVDVPISIDTRKHRVAEAALHAGASIVNDVSAGVSDPGMFDVVRAHDAGMVLMHMRGDPRTMQHLTDYQDVVAEVKAHLLKRVRAAVAAGIEWERLAVDPGIGFAKTASQSLLLLRDVAAFRELGRPVLVGPSRKSFIGHVLGTDVTARLEGTAGAVAWVVARGAHIVRVHDVGHMSQVVRVVEAIRSARDALEGALEPSGG
jgi:dihydropteroate synthase